MGKTWKWNVYMSKWLQELNKTLVPSISSEFKVLDLFAGCGGLALGFEAAGFETFGIEMDASAAQTYRSNLSGACLTEKISKDYEFPLADIIIGGPPCQPFSVGGLQAGVDDSRNGFPAFIASIEQVKPRMFLFENVRGMLYKNRDYFNSVLESLEKLGYKVEFRLMNASDYGVPQNRERVIVVGHNAEWEWPAPHAQKVTVGEAIGDLIELKSPKDRFLTPNQDAYIAKYELASKCVNPRDLYLDRPARTLTCRNLAGATGDMHRVKLKDGSRRRLSIREAARLQSFPDSFEFSGSDDSAFNQIGNAVAPLFAYALAVAFRNALENPASKVESRVSQSA
jgi:DNA (cytosine-5)-methyltransferase 1